MKKCKIVRMANRIPHRRLHETWCVNPQSKICFRCFRNAEVMHHDHIMNFVRRAIVRIAPSTAVAQRIWRHEGASFRGYVRVAPVRVCSECNGGDAGGKTSGWCGEPSPVYLNSFTMSLDELVEMRNPFSLAIDRRAKAEEIWLRTATRHIADRRAIVRRVHALVAAAAAERNSV